MQTAGRISPRNVTVYFPDSGTGPQPLLAARLYLELFVSSCVPITFPFRSRIVSNVSK
jgi:hypothetical protein